MESKKAIYNLIPQQYYPKTALIIEGTPLEEMLKTIQISGIQYPFIAKPDIGLRGSAVKKIHNVQELLSYNDKANFDYLVQDLIPFENEVGIFYVRYPNEKTGKITGIVSKEFSLNAMVDSLNDLNKEEVLRMKLNSAKAAEDLNFEKQIIKLDYLFDNLTLKH